MTAGAWVIAAVGTHLPPRRLGHIGIGDKVLHVAVYFVLSYLLTLTLGLSGMAWRRRILTVILILPIYAILDELTQPLVGRSADLRDFLADMLGVAIGLGLGQLMLWAMGRIWGIVSRR